MSTNTPNPYYDPNFQQMIISIKFEMAILSARIRSMPEADIHGDKYKELLRAYEEAQERYRKVAIRSFKTVQDFAKALFGELPKDTPLADPDFDSFQSPEQVMQEFKRYDQYLKLQDNILKNSLPRDGDAIKDLFKREQTNVVNLTFFFSNFGNVLLTIATEATETELNICIAPAYASALDLLNPDNYVLANVLLQMMSMPDDKSNVHFYIHIPPYEGEKEKFVRMNLRFDEKKHEFRDPTFEELDTIPSTIQRQRFFIPPVAGMGFAMDSLIPRPI
jgi:hypothetical protein